MRKLVQGIALAGATAASLIALPVAQGMAVTIAPVGISAANGNMVVDVANRGGSRYWKYRHGGGNWNHNGGNWHHGGNNWHHGGHGGHDNDWWWPGLAGVGVGLGLGLLNNAPYYYNQPVYRAAPAVNGSAAHVAWCERRYRSYDVGSNTFQPYNGPRQECVSPYM